jgi:CubicO group peptidase (beta-lactamase class C family)
MRDGKLIFSKAYGMADLTYGIPFSTTTPSNIGSVSKQFTAFAILLLEQQGKLSLDDDVRKHIPELPDLGEVVTLRNMVNHTNGFREVYNLMPMTGWKGEDQLRREDVIEVLKRQEELQASPGEEYNYNNSAFILLAEIVERTTGEKFPEWMKENVFEPMGMTSTAVRADPLTIIPGASQGYSMDSTGYRKAGDLYASYGAGGIYTTVADFNRWLSNLHDPVIGSSAVVTRLVTPDTLNNGDTMTYAKGIALGEFRGLKTWEHGGADIAHRATLLYFPEINAGVATLSNNASFPSGQIAYGLAEAFFKDQMEAEEEKKEEDAGESTEVTVPEDLLRAYAGEYRFIGIGIVAEYSLEEGVLFATVDEQPTLEMIPSSDSVFTYKGVEATLTFHVNAEGKVTGATHSQGGGQYQLVPVEPYNPGPEVLKAYEGRYFSRELETFYTLQLKDSTLVLKIRNTADIELSPMEEDSFSGDVFFITEMEFTRDAGGRVTGFDVSNGRTKGIRFDRSL